MRVETARLIYFSPTRTTKMIVEWISEGLEVPAIELVDLTQPEAETRHYPNTTCDVAIIGAPVYAGRIPTSVGSRLRRLKGRGMPAIIVVVYGNRAYEDALIELRDLAAEAGFKPIAAGAFVGEHSFSTAMLPIAEGRPDADDLKKAAAFGAVARAKIGGLPADAAIEQLEVPGNVPYKELRTLSDVSPQVNDLLCSKCRGCIPVCPVGAVNTTNPVFTDSSRCIKCCACIKNCPTGAKSMSDPRILQITEQLHVTFNNRKEPEVFI